MPTLFSDAVKKADDGQKSAIRALQAWQYLIAMARARTTIRYKELQELMEYPTCNPVLPALGCIAYYCKQNELPPLSSIVVNETGQPGEGYFEEILANVDSAWEQVFNYRWYCLIPPTVNELRTAYTKGRT